MSALKWLGVVMILAWLVLYLAVKITLGAIHLLLLVGLALVVVGLLKSQFRRRG